MLLMIVYVIENLYKNYKKEFDDLSNEIKKCLNFNSIDDYFEYIDSIDEKYMNVYNSILQNVKNCSKCKMEIELADVTLMCNDMNYLLSMLNEYTVIEARLYCLYHLITNHFVFENCSHYMKMFNEIYNDLSNEEKSCLSERIHIAKIMIDGYDLLSNKDYMNIVNEFIVRKSEINVYNNTEYLNAVLNQHILQFLDMYVRRNVCEYSDEEAIEFEKMFDDYMRKDLYFYGYEFSPFYADIKMQLFRIKYELDSLEQDHWTLHKYIENCEKNIQTTTKVLTQHNYVNQDFYFHLRDLDRTGVLYD